MLRVLLGLPALCLLLFAALPLAAQSGDEVLDREPAGVPIDLSYRPQPVRKQADADPLPLPVPPVPVDTLALPFRDHFTALAIVPTPFRWQASATVRQMRSIAYNPIDLGVAVMDGTNEYGDAYSNIEIGGFADSLLSQPVNLDSLTYSAADSIYLSFYVQCGGRAEQPEAQDSLVLFFREGGDSTYIFHQVWSMGGGLPVNRWFKVMVPVLDKRFLHRGFQFMFRNIATLTGSYDHWLIDGVYLDKGRSAIDTLPLDVGISELPRTLMPPYTALPRKHFQAFDTSLAMAGLVDLNPQLNVRLYNAFGFADQRNLNAEAKDLQNGQNLPNSPVLLNQQSIPSGYSSHSLGSLGKPDVSGTASVHPRLNVYMDANVDVNRQNDYASMHYSIDSILAFDDGEPETGYGMNVNRSFGQRFRLATDDTLRAVWLSFTPSRYVLRGSSFAIRVWSWPVSNPNQGILNGDWVSGVDFGNYHGDYVRYAYPNPNYDPSQAGSSPYASIPVPKDFAIGLLQFDTRPINLGLDQNFDNNTNLGENTIYRDSSGYWRASQIPGVLMIRAELVSGTTGPLILSTSQPIAEAGEAAVLVPNPSTGICQLHWTECPQGSTHLRLIDAAGRTVWQQTSQALAQQTLDMGHLPNGLFLLVADYTTARGTQGRYSTRLLLQR